jgi:hypothetical protein
VTVGADPNLTQTTLPRSREKAAAISTRTGTHKIALLNLVSIRVADIRNTRIVIVYFDLEYSVHLGELL